MAKPVGNPDPGIPAVFVTQKTGMTIKRLMTPGVTDALLTPVRTLSALGFGSIFMLQATPSSARAPLSALSVQNAA